MAEKKPVPKKRTSKVSVSKKSTGNLKLKDGKADHVKGGYGAFRI